jgi:catechol 2,3-dioxygenase-like lactoylglutathione lyase family enzyme
MTRIPRMHHNAYVTRDMAATRKFYEELIGLPLVATWCESDVLFGKPRTYCHTFFALGDGSALTFFQFAEAGDQRQFGPDIPSSPFVHLALAVDAATQAAIEKRLVDAGYQEPQIYTLDHGYCRSFYVKDPNGLILEFACDHPDAARINRNKVPTAHRDLLQWLEGNHASNNPFRAHEQPVG